MRNYYPQFHSSDNLRTQIAEVYTRHPDMLVVGSLGRAATYGALKDNPYFEFEQRQQNPLHAGTTARDIDVIGADPDFVPWTLPFWVDATSYDIGGTKLTQENGEWLISVEDHFEAPLHPAVMEPIPAATIYDIPCITLPAETQAALLKVRGRFREKDVQTFSLLSDLIELKPTADRLPAELFVPFERVHQINTARFS